MSVMASCFGLVRTQAVWLLDELSSRQCLVVITVCNWLCRQVLFCDHGRVWNYTFGQRWHTFPLVTREHRTDDGGRQSNYLHTCIYSRPTLRTTRGCVLRQELNEKDILIICAAGVAKKVKKTNRESPTGIESMTYQIPDARSELRRESWCYVKRVLYSAKMPRST